MALIAPLAVVALLVNVTFLREPLNVRLADAAVPAVLLGAWLMAEARGARLYRPALTACAAAGLAIFSASALVLRATESAGAGRRQAVR
jgi:hypothetical protein